MRTTYDFRAANSRGQRCPTRGEGVITIGRGLTSFDSITSGRKMADTGIKPGLNSRYRPNEDNNCLLFRLLPTSIAALGLSWLGRQKWRSASFGQSRLLTESQFERGTALGILHVASGKNPLPGRNRGGERDCKELPALETDPRRQRDL